MATKKITINEFRGLVKKIIREETDSVTASEKLNNTLSSSSVSNFVAKFKQIASDSKVQDLLKAGLNDGNQNDESVNYNEGILSVGGLIPTQSEIGFNQSIANILTDQYGSLKSILDGKANVGGPIVTYNNKYIIDGHHRWSQVYAANPKAKMQVLNINGDLNPTAILKIVHVSVALKAGGVPSADPKGINILDGITDKQVLDAVNTNLSDKAKKIWASKGYGDNTSIAKLIYKNLMMLINKNKPIQGAPGRKDMPQTDQPEGSKSSEKLDLLAKGVVNFKNPKPSDINELKVLLKRIINENDNNNAFNAELKNAGGDISRILGQELKNRGQLNEDLITSTIIAILTGNTLIGYISKLSKQLFKLLNWKKGENFAEKVHHWAHKNEVAFQAPIKRVLSVFIKDKNTLDTTTKTIYAIVIASMAINYGVDALDNLAKSDWFKSSVLALKSVAKTDEAIVNSYPAIKYLLK